MANLLSQLEDALNVQAENLCNSIGVLQRSPPAGSNDTDKMSEKETVPEVDYCQAFANLIAKTAKHIDELIDSLPNEDVYSECQDDSIKRLEEENIEAARKLEEVVVKGEILLQQIRDALSLLSSNDKPQS